jgi:HSP20 family protein
MEKRFMFNLQEIFNDKNINNIARDTTKKIVKNVSNFLEDLNDDEDNSDEDTNIKNLLLDIYENNETYMVLVDIPGTNKNNITVDILNDNLLSISVNFDTIIDSNYKIVRSERLKGLFKREIKLPKNVDQNTITAKYEKGVLTLTLNKIIRKTVPIF